MGSTNKSKEVLLNEISMIDFAVVEMTEYLDTHPEDQGACDYILYYTNRKNQLMKEFSYQYYPLRICDTDSVSHSWKWTKQSIPW